MKLLFITPYLPSEISGHAGAQLIFRNIKVLASQHTISVATFINSEEKAKTHELEELGISLIPVLYERNRRGLGGINAGFHPKLFSNNKINLGDRYILYC